MKRMHNNDEDQFIVYNRFISSKLQVNNNQLIYSNQQQTVNSWMS